MRRQEISLAGVSWCRPGMVEGSLSSERTVMRTLVIHSDVLGPLLGPLSPPDIARIMTK